MERSITAIGLGAPLGLWVWALHFAVVYGFNALACARGLASEAAVDLVVLCATVVAGSLNFALATGAFVPARPDDEMLRYLTRACGWLGLAGIVLNAIPALIVRSC